MVEKAICFLFCGELGWEYLRFQGYCRRMAIELKNMSGSKYLFFVCTHEGRDVFYRDFCDGHIFHKWWFTLNSDNGNTDFGENHGYGKVWLKDKDFKRLKNWAGIVIKQKYGVPCEVVSHGLGIKYYMCYETQHMCKITEFKEKEIWHKLKEDYLFGFNNIVAICPRHRKIADGRNWGEEKYRELIDRFMMADIGVVICGHPHYSVCLDLRTQYGVVNLTELPSIYSLDLTLCAFEDCNYAIGSQSALPVIALGQGVPTIMWGCEKIRHSQIYNWTNTSCLFLEDQTYSLSPECIFENSVEFAHNAVKWNPSDNMEWQMLRQGDFLPQEKNKEK